MTLRIHYRIAILLACLLYAGTARAQKTNEPLRVGVVVVASINVDQTTALDISDELGAALEQARHIDAVAGGEATARLSKEILKDLGDDCVVNKSCIRAVGAALGVQELLFLVVVRVANQVQVNTTWADVASAATNTRERISLSRSAVAERSDEMRSAFTAAVTLLVPNAKPKPVEQPANTDPVENPGTGVNPPLNGQGGTTPGGDAPGAGSTTGSDSGGRRIPMGTWIAGGVSVAALAGGIGFGVAALGVKRDLDDDLDDNGDNCKETKSCDPDKVDRLQSRTRAADVLFAVSGVAALTAGVIYYLAKDSEPSDSQVAIEPSLGSDSVGVLVHGRF